MKKEQIQQKLLKATEELLLEMESPDEITTRQIAAKAGTNVAMINYCFQSKDELLNDAIGHIIQDSAEIKRNANDTGIPAINRLWNMLWELCELVLKFRKFTKLSIPYLLLQSDIETPLYILPLVREHFVSEKSEEECRVIAYQLISFIQLVFYRSEAFSRYSGINILEPAEAERLLETEFRLLLKGDFTHE